VYRPRDAEHTVLHQVVALHLEAFLGAVAEAGDGAGLPQFVELMPRITRAQLPNPLYAADNTLMCFADGKKAVLDAVDALKHAA
jgi:hypothetical protein